MLDCKSTRLIETPQWRPEGNPLDLNNLPDDNYTRDGKQPSEDTSSSAGGGYMRKKKSGGKEGDEQGKVETETLNKARQLVFTNDLAPAGHLGYVSGGQPISHGGYHQARLFSNSSPLIPPPPPPPPAAPTPPYMYTSPPRLLSFHSQYPTPPPANDYFLGHVLSNPTHEGNYTCIGAPVGHGGIGGGVGGGGVRDMSVHNQEEGLNWGRR
ncbi:hypothetical protein DH2020_034201 [Rehmannia glutinosa]|uniref:Uncharacterized protein n=1 Tax=Rehmannia glutinosa TaxID=99300 RepID=A0ABR0VA07_REHGL